MNATDVLEISREAIWVMLKIAAPLMLTALIVGLVISLVQALTQIQEQTLVFVPKILAIFATMLVALPFMGDLMNGIMGRIMSKVVLGG